MGLVAIIGGSGFAGLPGLVEDQRQVVATPFGPTSAPLLRGRLAGRPLLFLARHGEGHALPPHRVNYRANVAALADAGADRIVALGAVGGIAPFCAPGTLVIPDQLIDYTHGRAATFHDGGDSGVVHVDFSRPYDEPLRRALIEAGGAAGVPMHDGGTYGVTQGPRLETAAEIARLRRDGCDLVGMTALPEAALARERGVAYATLAFVVNWAAGVGIGEIAMDEIDRNIGHCAPAIGRVLAAFAQRAG